MNKLVIKQKLLLGGRDEMNRNLEKVERKASESCYFLHRHEKEKHEKFYGHFKKRLFEHGSIRWVEADAM